MRRRAADAATDHGSGGEERAPRKPRADKAAPEGASRKTPGFAKAGVKAGTKFGGKFDRPPERASAPFKKPTGKPRDVKPPEAPAPREKAFEGERIAKVMARAGVCSRRDAESWIEQGRVAVNGRALSSPAVNVREGDKITLDGKPLQERERTRLFLFHKPAGVVTSARDPEGRATVFAFLDERHPDLPRVVSVGRLDINTEGLLLLTNDGGLARALELPATGWTRRYRVRAHGAIEQATLDGLRNGITVDGVAYAPIEASLDRVQGANAWITMSLTEGKNREIKRVFEHLGLDVTRLIRVSYGPFQLGDIEEGAVEEVRLKVLRDQLGKGLAELAGVDFSSPLRDRATPTATETQEARERAARRPRKHVSVLRKQRDEQSDRGPRARIERGATADRKGRAVAVERVVLTKKRNAPASDDAAPSRNARRFDEMRRTGERPRTGERKPRDAGYDDRRPRRDERSRDGGRTSGGDRKFDATRGRRDSVAPSSRQGDARGERRFEKPRFDDARSPRGARDNAAPGRPPRGPRDDRAERPRQRRDGAAPPSRQGDARGERRFEKPRFDEARSPRGARDNAAPGRPPRGPRDDRAERPRQRRDGAASARSDQSGERGERRFEKPRFEGARAPGGSRDYKSPRKPGGAGERSGAGKPGGARKFDATRKPGSNFKGPRKPRDGDAKGPRKPRGPR